MLRNYIGTSTLEGPVAFIFFDPEGGGSKFLQNVCTCIPHYTVSHLTALLPSRIHVQTFVLFGSVIIYYITQKSEFFHNLSCTNLNMLCTGTFLKIEGVK